MLISDSKKFIFFHICKTGGSTVYWAIAQFDTRKFSRWIVPLPKSKRVVFKHHMVYEDFLEYPESELLNQYYSFCTIRNPYDRFYSSYTQHGLALNPPKEGRYPDHPPSTYHNMTAQQLWAEYQKLSMFDYCKKYLTFDVVRYDEVFHDLCPQTCYTHYQNKLVMNYMIRNEGLEQDFQQVCKNLKLGRIELTNYNVRVPPQKGYKYIDKYDHKMIDFIHDLYHQDFELLEYPKIDD